MNEIEILRRVAQALQSLARIGGYADRHFIVRHQLTHQRAHLLDAGRVEAIGRLVEDEEFGAGKERGAEGEAQELDKLVAAAEGPIGTLRGLPRRHDAAMVEAAEQAGVSGVELAA